MGNPDATANAIKELTKEIKKQNKLLENLTEAVKNTNYIYKVTPTYKPEPIDPLNPYRITCETGPYYGTKVDTSDWTNKDSLEALN